ncbi:hypothetical protein LJC74_06780 [Eubacteriales bacterium OttesenSCG-928-A19]|nr:hypothetical protein [Eubacteriales bacterium OttesenSCG-928-A19]
MKRLFALCVFVLMLVSAVTAPAFAREAQASQEYAVYGIAVHTWAGDEGQWPLSPEEEARRVYVSIPGAYATMYVTVLPEGGADEPLSYNYVPVRLTFEELVEVLRSGTRVYSVDIEDDVLRPTAVERVGTASYGVIAEIGEDYLVHQVWYDTSEHPGPGMDGGVLSPRYVITPDTLVFIYSDLPFDELFTPGHSCELIADEDGNVLTIESANG